MKKIRIYGVPMDLGQKRRGVDMGPSAIRYAGLQERLEKLGYEVNDGGNISVPVVEQIEPDPTDGRALNAHAVGAICRSVHDQMAQVIASGDIGIFLGGDHSIALGTVSAALERSQKVGVLWIDAHGDFNTPETSPSGSIHGMPVATLVGRGCEDLVNLGHPGPKLLPEDVVMIGVRDLDPGERAALVMSGIHVYTMRDIDELGMGTVARRSLEHLRDLPRLHISLDMDSIDPGVTPGVGTPVPGGMSFREAHLLMEILAESGKVDAVDVVEINPILDHRNTTAEMAVALVASLLGQRIL